MDYTEPTPAQLFAQFPELASVMGATDESAQMWLDTAALLVSKHTWRQLWQTGVLLLAAHYLALAYQATLAAGQGALPSGPTNRKYVGDVGTGSDANIGMVAEGDSYNLTLYGRQYLQLARLVGVGSRYLVR